MEHKYPSKSLSTGKPVAMETTIRLSKQLLHNRAVQVSQGDHVIQCNTPHITVKTTGYFI